MFCFCFFLSSQGEGLPLLQEEKNEIEALLPPTTSEEDKEKIFSILGQALCRPTGIQVNFFYHRCLIEVCQSKVYLSS